MQEFREFAVLIDKALRNNDIGFFRARAVTEPVVCTVRDVEQRSHLGSCDTAGQEFQGFPIAVWRSDGAGLVPLETALAFMEDLWTTQVTGFEDAFGGSDARVHALGENAGIPSGPAQIAVLTAIVERPITIAGEGPLRVAFGTHWRMTEGEWRFIYLLEARVLGEDLLTEDGVGAGWVHSWELFQSE